MFQNSERGNSGPGGSNNTGFTESTIGTWFNPAKESKKGTKIQIIEVEISIKLINTILQSKLRLSIINLNIKPSFIKRLKNIMLIINFII